MADRRTLLVEPFLKRWFTSSFPGNWLQGDIIVEMIDRRFAIYPHHGVFWYTRVFTGCLDLGGSGRMDNRVKDRLHHS